MVQAHGVEAEGTFGISFEDSAHIMTILRDTLYSDKVMAVLREYSTNAWDAHRDAGKKDIPIEITLPTPMDPTLSIRDFGNGLSKEDVFKVYTQYGASTKRNSDDTVGMLGIGSKSAFAYSDSFTVTSFHNGKKATYVAVLDKTNKGIMNLLAEEDCAPEETGVLIQIAIRPKDIPEFQDKSRNLFKYFEPRPKINVDLPELPQKKADLHHGCIYEDSYRVNSGQWVAIMGCVPYRINLNQLSDRGQNGRLPEYLYNMTGALFFDIGAVTINASREELKYSDNTKDALVQKFNDLIDEYVQKSLNAIKHGNFTLWEQRIKAQILRHMGLPVPDDTKVLLASFIDLKKKVPDSFTIHQGPRSKDTVETVTVSAEVRLLLRNDNRMLQGYRLGHYDYIIRKNPDKKVTWAKVEKDLEKMIDDAKMTGVTVKSLSELEWNQPTRMPTGRTVNPKHKMKFFQYDHSKDQAYGGIKSEAWLAVSREPDPKDVFVILEEFKSKGLKLHNEYQKDELIAKILGKPLPFIYGYKSTEKKPVAEKDVTGIPYLTWQKEFRKQALQSPAMLEAYSLWEWNEAFRSDLEQRRTKNGRYVNNTHDGRVKMLTNLYGANHLITYIYKRHLEAQKKFEDMDYRTTQVYSDLFESHFSKVKSEAALKMEELKQKYPMLHLVGFPSVWSKEHRRTIHQYVQLMDKNP